MKWIIELTTNYIFSFLSFRIFFFLIPHKFFAFFAFVSFFLCVFTEYIFFVDMNGISRRIFRVIIVIVISDINSFSLLRLPFYEYLFQVINIQQSNVDNRHEYDSVSKKMILRFAFSDKAHSRWKSIYWSKWCGAIHSRVLPYVRDIHKKKGTCIKDCFQLDRRTFFVEVLFIEMSSRWEFFSYFPSFNKSCC